MAHITTTPLFLNTIVGSGSAGGTSLSDPIDLRQDTPLGRFSLSYRVKPSGAAATAGTTTFSWLVSPTRDGTYVLETGTSGTSVAGATGGTGAFEIKPSVTPFMKMRVIVGTSGVNSVSAELHAQ